MIAKIEIDGHEFEVRDGITVLEACRDLDIFVPYLCYLKEALPSGACGLCVVEIDDEQISLACKTKIHSGMKIKTNSPKLLNIRELNLQKILDNHEINCLNCTKNGTCRLQIISARIFGYNQQFGSTAQKKRKIVQKLCDDLIFTNSKCTNCMRCVKFLNSRHSQKISNISMFEEIKNRSNLSLNIIDLCPTAALSSISGQKQPAFLCKSKKTLDTSDAFFSPMEVKTYENQIVVLRGASHDSLLNDEMRIEGQNLPNRVFDQKLYDRATEQISVAINTSEQHEKVAFIFGNIVDIVSASYIQFLSQNFQNVLIATDGHSIKDTPHKIGLDKSDLLFMENVTFLGNFKDSEIYKITSSSNRLKSYEFSEAPKNLDPSSYVLISARSFNDYKDCDFLKTFENIRIIPSKPSHMLLRDFQNVLSLEEVCCEYNRHDIKLLCTLGNIDFDLTNLGIPTIYHAALKPSCADLWIPSAHPLEHTAFYKNIFGEIVKAEAVVESPLKSNSDFMIDLFKKVFAYEADCKIKSVQMDIRKRFFN